MSHFFSKSVKIEKRYFGNYLCTKISIPLGIDNFFKLAGATLGLHSKILKETLYRYVARIKGFVGRDISLQTRYLRTPVLYSNSAFMFVRISGVVVAHTSVTFYRISYKYSG